MKMIFKVVLLSTCLIWAPLASHALELQETASYVFPDTESDAHARDVTLARVKKKVLEAVCGTQITGGAGRFKSEGIDELSLFHFETVGGRISGSSIISSEMNAIGQGPGQTRTHGLKECHVIASITVECDRGKRDPSFAPSFASDVQMNGSYLREGEEMVISMKAASTLYVTALQYVPSEHSEQKVFKIFPNESQSGNQVKEGQDLKIPDSKSGHKYKLVAQLPEKLEQAAEELMLVATKEQVKFPDIMSLGDFQKILSEIPLNDRREAMLPYLIVKAKKVHGSEQ
jgi:hypothetical protein